MAARKRGPKRRVARGRSKAISRVGFGPPALESDESKGTSLPRPDEYTDKQRGSFSQNWQLISLLEMGIKPKAALDRLEIKRTARWARWLYRRYKSEGEAALLDGRSYREHEPTVLTGEVQKLIMMWWAARRAAGATAIARKVEKECESRGLKPPSESLVKHFLANLPEYMKLFRTEEGIRVWERTMRPCVEIENTQFSNQRWQTDHTFVDIWVRIQVGDLWIPTQAFLTVYLDAHSRSIPGIVLSARYPDAWTTSLLMMHAVMPKKDARWKNKWLPNIVQPDRGRDFMSATVFTAFGHLKIIRIPDPPYYPNGKGKVERWFETLDYGCLRMLPGHKEAVGRNIARAIKHLPVLLTVPQLRREIERWIVEEYHQRKHSETGRKPIELWEETVRPRKPESEDDLYIFLLRTDEVRMVKPQGIHFKPRNSRDDEETYWWPELAYYVGVQVRLGFNPDDLESVLVYDAATSKRLCEAWVMGKPYSRYDYKDVKAVRGQISHGLKDRLKDYRKEVEEMDRKNAQQADWEAARLKEEELSREEETMDESSLESSEDTERINAILERFKQQDRGQS